MRVLLVKARQGEIVGFAFVALKRRGICAGTVNIRDQDQALATAGRLMDAILGKEAFINTLEK